MSRVFSYVATGNQCTHLTPCPHSTNLAGWTFSSHYRGGSERLLTRQGPPETTGLQPRHLTPPMRAGSSELSLGDSPKLGTTDLEVSPAKLLALMSP